MLPRRLVGPAPCVAYTGTHGGLQVVLVWAGKCPTTGVDNVGTVPAALATYLGCLAYKPDLVISAGTAGGFKAQVGRALGLCSVPPPRTRARDWGFRGTGHSTCLDLDAGGRGDEGVVLQGIGAHAASQGGQLGTRTSLLSQGGARVPCVLGRCEQLRPCCSCDHVSIPALPNHCQ